MGIPPEVVCLTFPLIVLLLYECDLEYTVKINHCIIWNFLNQLYWKSSNKEEKFILLERSKQHKVDELKN